jgi:hypothetical protein
LWSAVNPICLFALLLLAVMSGFILSRLFLGLLVTVCSYPQ